jgi:outer membrane protein TolC
VDEAVKEAYAHREDLQGQEAALLAARTAERAALAERLPSVAVDANWGPIGQTPASAVSTYTVAANVRVPLFNAGAAKAHAIQASAAMRRRQAELEDTRAKVYYEVQATLLDVAAAQAQVDVATRAADLAQQQLTQARDRFSAGVTDTIEVVQAQEALAGAHDAQVGSVYGYNAAKAALAGALGLAEEEMPRFLGVVK